MTRYFSGSAIVAAVAGFGLLIGLAAPASAVTLNFVGLNADVALSFFLLRPCFNLRLPLSPCCNGLSSSGNPVSSNGGFLAAVMSAGQPHTPPADRIRGDARPNPRERGIAATIPSCAAQRDLHPEQESVCDIAVTNRRNFSAMQRALWRGPPAMQRAASNGWRPDSPD
jgi:hypothetical protein